ncbi:purine-binding chemotaxis protein CheW [Brevibacillus sp. SYP-B805]|uniref:chemotaxis protein CheW n=1 Tax=Brevibacillus sp. SYP-B805 TaxID=1578199 RepID=UPI0013EAF543|nr:chemotaxis protein CheW [Brevibacillus sp. SYP-B805]NGQ95835.1 purine-binding chemotaxis protein CheW [Brevibacillus sp. SYP-B805]
MSKAAVSQKEVIFRINQEEYGISVTEVVSIEKAHDITTVPRQNPFLLGVIHLRGSVIPVVDLHHALQGTPARITDSTRYIIVSVGDEVVGFVVDAATDIIDVPQSIIQKPAVVRSDFIYGIAKLDQRMIVLLDIPRLMSGIIGDISV